MKNQTENEAGILVPDLFLVFRKALYELKASALHLSFDMFQYSSTCHTKKNKLYETLTYWWRHILNIDFMNASVAIVYPLHLVYDLSRKMFFTFYSINFASKFYCLFYLFNYLFFFNFILFQIFISFSFHLIINFEINLIFLINLLFCMTKISKQ